MRTNIGGSILPSNCPLILQPMPFRGGVLQVVPDYEADTHRLTYNGEVIASHANGYSCHALAERMIAGNAQRVKEQAEYVVACGGKSDMETIQRLLAS